MKAQPDGRGMQAGGGLGPAGLGRGVAKELLLSMGGLVPQSPSPPWGSEPHYALRLEVATPIPPQRLEASLGRHRAHRHTLLEAVHNSFPRRELLRG